MSARVLPSHDDPRRAPSVIGISRAPRCSPCSGDKGRRAGHAPVRIARGGNMTIWLRWLVATIFLAVSSAAVAEFHLYYIEQIYSSADGTVQFIVMREGAGANGEHRWGGH